MNIIITSVFFVCAVALGVIANALLEANRLKKIELRRMGISEEEIKGK